ncbi:hypothetical protein [Taklimakanibacter albus]|uniref:Uncharacterized protein n=1 Tax=Taklimakanibacter albus TaxID=2800327 RepID=A0ACC5R1X1_9HYPH|nr:hypothetical protein [Aestuariivirga sp. YIM B02566]MBK1866393.1 hypothetical protein [Aestuariivirga sp. YIM B02566]
MSSRTSSTAAIIAALSLLAAGIFPAKAGPAEELDNLLAEIEASVIAGQHTLFGVRNGEYFVTNFDVATLDLDAEQEKLRLKYPSSKTKAKCNYEDLGMESDYAGNSSISLIYEVYETSAAGHEMYTRLADTKQALGVVGRVWDFKSGDREYCNRKAFRIFFKNGKALNINYTDVSF